MRKEKIAAQHGDVILFACDKEPKGLVWKREKKGFIVEKGEGVHTHFTTCDCEIAEKDGVLYLREINCSQNGVGLDHEEHGVKILERGKVYFKDIENEFDAETEEARKTKD